MPSRMPRVSDRIIRSATAVLSLLVSSEAQATTSSDELVRQARVQEAAHEPDIAARRYMDALSVDPLSASAWIGLGSLRMMLDDPEEAERVYTAAIDHIPTLAPALAGRARARWKLGKHRAAEIDMQRYTDETSDQGAMRELSSWYSTDGRLPAELALWRRLQAMAIGRDDSVAVGEARPMILALMLLVSTADPVSQPVEPDRTRADLAAIARHCFGRP